MSNESVLHQQPQRQARRGRPEHCASAPLGSVTRCGVECRAVSSRWGAVALQAEISRTAITQDDSDERQKHQRRAGAGREESITKTQAVDHIEQKRYADDRSAEADQRAQNVRPVIDAIRAARVVKVRDIAAALNARGIATARGGRWHPSTVQNILART